MARLVVAAVAAGFLGLAAAAEPRFEIPGHEREAALLAELQAIHLPAAASRCGLWDAWLPRATLWTSDEQAWRYRQILRERPIAPFLRLEWAGDELLPTASATVSWLREGEQAFPKGREVAIAAPGRPAYVNVPLFKEPDFTGPITRFRIAIHGGAGGRVRLASICTAVDSRHPVTNPLFVIGVADAFLWTGDIEFLKELMPRLRQAVGFTRRECGLERGRHAVIGWPGPDDAWRRLAAITEWFASVQAAGGYRAYYAVPGRGSLQGGGTPGGLGCDMEFLESVLVPQVVLEGFLGLEPTVDGCRISPRLPADWPAVTVRGIHLQGGVIDATADRDGTVAVDLVRPAPRPLAVEVGVARGVLDAARPRLRLAGPAPKILSP
jgi:hypothetical protein